MEFHRNLRGADGREKQRIHKEKKTPQKVLDGKELELNIAPVCDLNVTRTGRVGPAGGSDQNFGGSADKTADSSLGPVVTSLASLNKT